MTDFTTGFSVSLADSVAFSRLCGDCNPLHVDAIGARRLRFGSTVTHGIHLFLRSLDELAERGLLQGQTPILLSATFNNAVTSGERVTLDASTHGNKLRLSGAAGGTQAFTASVELQPEIASGGPIEDAEFAPARPDELDFPPAVSEGTVPLRLSESLLMSLFPALAALPGHGWIADLLATTQIIGMRCPGMHSIYSGFKLQRSLAGVAARAMHYHMQGTEKRLQMIRLQVVGAYLNGMIEAFFRARPVEQRSLREIATSIAPNIFAGHRVLVVGGSRGLGELTAKLAAAGGADVTITYAKGADDARRICAEADELGHKCAMQPLDVLSLSAPDDLPWLTSAAFTHVYFFASPPIAMNVGRWDAALFDKFTRIYVTAFATLVERILDARISKRQSVRFLYPSSVFASQPEAGFAEYAVAKAAGEALCDQLQGRRGAQFSKPRMPRMHTDQTSSVTDIGAADPFPVMLEVVRAFHA